MNLMRSRFTSLDGNESVRGELARPDRYRHLFAALSAEGPSIARGAGLSYCAASAGDRVRSISSLLFNRILEFDGETGLIVVEPGLSVGDLFEFAVSRGWYPPVLPGHPKITIGGCVGFNVHGKSQHHGGNFIRCIERLVVYHPDHGEITCSREAHSDLFALTVGGFGLTGFVTSVTLRLVPLPGGSVLHSRIRVANLVAAVEVMEAHRESSGCLYSWHDLNRRGDALGPGVVYVETFDSRSVPRRGRFRDLDATNRDRFRVPFLNRPTTVLMNRAYHRLEVSRGESLLDLRTAAFPINGKEIYYALFGRRGLREYQMLVPREEWEPTVGEVGRLLARSGVAATLGSLKLFEGSTTFLNFSGSGVCLTIDVPATARALGLFADLDQVVARVGGLVNPSKDSRLTANVVQRIFPEYQKFKEEIERYDPQRRFDSTLRRRLLG